MPPHLSSELPLQPKGINMLSVCCNHFGLRMPQTQPLEPHKPPLPAGGPDKTALPLGRVADYAMCWVKECFHLWQSFSGALMRALLMGIANVAGRLAASAPLEKGKTPSGGREEVGRQKSKLDDGEKLRCKAGPRGYLILSSLKCWTQEDGKSFTEGGHFGGCPKQFSHSAEMDKVDVEDHPAWCLLRHSISSDCESALEGEGREAAACPGSFPQNPLGSMGAGEFSGESCSSHEESGDFENDLEGDSRESVESPSASQECKESIDRSRDSVMLGNQSVGGRPGSTEDGECLSQYGKAKGNLGMHPLSDSFQSPLVLSLFCSPSEEEEEEEDSEDWSIEDEMKETRQLYLDGAVSGNGDSSAAAEENSQHQDFPENFCRSCFPNTDPSPSLCVSRSIQPTTFASPEPRRHKEITTSFHLRRPDSQWEQLCDPPKKQSSATGHPPHHCCQMKTERNGALVPTEASLGSQKESRRGKKVRFSPEVTVHTLVVWDYASRAARRGPWEEMARDRCRFQRRIAEVGAHLEPCLEMEHRAKAWRKICRALEGP